MSELLTLPGSRYLSEEEVLDTENPFVQLLSGVVWLIRNGSIYINESQATECDETQETGAGEGRLAAAGARQWGMLSKRHLTGVY